MKRLSELDLKKEDIQILETIREKSDELHSEVVEKRGEARLRSEVKICGQRFGFIQRNQELL